MFILIASIKKKTENVNRVFNGIKSIKIYRFRLAAFTFINVNAFNDVTKLTVHRYYLYNDGGR